jgi:hypothetical protein
MKKIIAFVLVAVMLALTFTACGSAPTKVRINCTVSVVVNGEKLLDTFPYTVTGTEEKMPTVLQTVVEAFTVADIPCEYNDEEFLSVSFNGTKYARGMDEENVYSWIYRVDGVEPTSGRMSNNTVAEGQNIELELIAIPLETNKTEAAE